MVMGSCCHIFYFTYLFSLIPSEKSRFSTWPLGQKLFVFNIGNFPWITILYKYGSSLCALRAPLVYLDYFALEMKIDTWPDGNISSCNCVERENIPSASNRFETRENSIYNIGLRVTLYVTQIYICIYILEYTWKKERAISYVQKLSPNFSLLESNRCPLSSFFALIL